MNLRSSGRGWWCWLVAGALWGSVGCVHEVVIEPGLARRMTPLLVAQTDGVSELEWDSEVGQYYSVMYATELGTRVQWLPLPGHQNRPGTGRRMRCADLVPDGVKRVYSLRVSPTPQP